MDHSSVNTAWNVNGTAYGHNEIIKLGIVTTGGPQQSNLTIHGYPEYNNTETICIASGHLNAMDPNSFYYNFDNATLRIQGNTLSDNMSLHLLSLGQLSAVNNLLCHVESQYINCSWSPPFSLVSIPVYIINVTYGGKLVTQNTTSSTTWQYCPSQFGTYTISEDNMATTDIVNSYYIKMYRYDYINTILFSFII